MPRFKKSAPSAPGASPASPLAGLALAAALAAGLFAPASAARANAAADAADVAVLSAPAAAPILLGETHRLRSAYLSEERTYRLRLPPEIASADSAREVTLLLVLDADSLFAPAAVFAEMLESAGAAAPVVVVSVKSVEGPGRVRDFTQAASRSGRNGLINERMPLRGGGAEAFHSFMEEELFEDVARRLPSGVRITRSVLAGAGFEGLFAIGELLRHPGCFDGFAAIDPALWWDRGSLTGRAVRSGARGAAEGARMPALFLAFPRAGEDPEDAFAAREIATFRRGAVPALAGQGVAVTIRDFEDETSASVRPAALWAAMRALLPAPSAAGLASRDAGDLK